MAALKLLASIAQMFSDGVRFGWQYSSSKSDLSVEA